jgi:transcriptional regulator with XRE-family HTH domain
LPVCTIVLFAANCLFLTSPAGKKLHNKFDIWAIYSAKKQNMTTATKEKVINNIKTIRENKDFTEAWVAEQMGISQSTYNRKENGESDFSLPELLKLGEVLEVNVTKIIDLDFEKMLTQNNYDGSSHNYLAGTNNISNEDGYKAAIAAYEKETEFLREQLKVVIQALAGKG